jgi:hypothetical protein
MRITESGPLPGEYGATDRTGLVGKAWAIAVDARRLADRTAQASQVARTKRVGVVCMIQGPSEEVVG